MIAIDLNAWEWRLINLLSNARNEISKRSGYYREPGNRNDPKQVAFLGVAGEIAFYKLIDRFPIISQDKSNASTPDTIINGKTIDVKGTLETTNDLMVSTDAKKHYDIYVAMAVKSPRVYYLGYFDSVKLFVPERIYTPQSLNGVERTPFYRALNSELCTDKFWE